MFQTNDLVTLKPAYRGKYKGVFRVTKTPGGARKKFLIRGVGSDLGVNAYGYMLDAFTGDLDKAPAGPPTLGSFVTIKNPQVNPNTVFIVLSATKTGARVVLPGGKGGFRNVSFNSLTVISPEDVMVL